MPPADEYLMHTNFLWGFSTWQFNKQIAIKFYAQLKNIKIHRLYI